MKQLSKRLTYANVMSSIAVFLVLGGATAFAATELGKNTVGTKQLKANAVTTGKIKKEAVAGGKIKNGAVGESKLATSAVGESKLGASAVTNGKLADNAVNSPKLAAGSVTAGKIADSSVGANQLTEAERSQVFVSDTSAGTKEVANGLFGSYTSAQSVISLNLPAGNYVVTGQSEFINVDVTAEYTAIHPAICRLLDDGSEIAEQSATVQPGLLAPTGGLTAVGVVSGGGQIDLACRAGGPAAKMFAYKAKIIATRVATVTGP